MKRRRVSVIVPTAVVSLVLIGTSMLSPAVTRIASAKSVAAKSCVTAPAPNFTGASKKYKGQSIIYYGDSVGCGHDMDVAAMKKFSAATGINVKIVEKPSDSDQAYATYSRLFQAGSGNIDVMMLDVIWPSAFGNNLTNLKPYFGSVIGRYYSSIVANDTIKGRLVAIPWFADAGLLYYRKDLFAKYHISGPPATWPELFADAKKIQDGEQKSNKSFYGFVFQGKAYEGLTCDALEWIASSGGGTIVNNAKKVTLDNKNAASILNLVKSQIGVTTPRDVTTYTETESDNAFNNGQAAFMRNWPYAYAAAQPTLKGKVGTAPLPHMNGGKSSATVGGWQLGVSKNSKHVGASVELVRYLTSPAVEKWRAVVATFLPSIPSLYSNGAVAKAMPFIKSIGAEVHVTRPSRALGTRYNEASNIFWTGISQILNGSDAGSVLPGTARRLQRLTS